MMFAQANSEHCRHKIFNADWIVDGVQQDKSLFAMIRNTHARHPEHTVVAYSDNAAVMEGDTAPRFQPDASGVYRLAGRSDPHPDEGGNAQPPDRHRAVIPAQPRVPAARSATKVPPGGARNRRPG